MPVTPSLALLPAASVTVPLADWSAPSPRTFGAGQLAVPDSASAQVNVTVTSCLYQPASFLASDAVAEMVGGVLSMLTTAVLLAELLALSVAVPTTC